MDASGNKGVHFYFIFLLLFLKICARMITTNKWRFDYGQKTFIALLAARKAIRESHGYRYNAEFAVQNPNSGKWELMPYREALEIVEDMIKKVEEVKEN